jgi:hypothetical protein
VLARAPTRAPGEGETHAARTRAKARRLQHLSLNPLQRSMRPESCKLFPRERKK